MPQMIPILTAVIGAIVVIVGAMVARNATHYTAELQAVQRRRDAELQDLLEFRDAVVDALHALGEYLFVLRHMALPNEAAFERLSDESPVLERRMKHLLPLVGERERLRNLAIGLLWEDLREAARPLDELIQLLRDDKVIEAFALHEANPGMTDQLVHLIGERRRQLVTSYPTSVPMTPFRYWPSKSGGRQAGL